MKIVFLVLLTCNIDGGCAEIHTPMAGQSISQCEAIVGKLTADPIEPNAAGEMLSGGRCQYEANAATYIVPKL